ncbi:nucleoside-triphosphatase [Algoriphagus namhaensis]|uniref:Nucleoside-triphosphatase n=1 Tax=Algoriphagus namhaensis TaxID=915353 RepID=A0ABV8ARF8_9BACT
MGANQSLEITLLTGPKRAGKTTWLHKNKSASAGFLSPIVSEKRQFLLLPSSETFPMEEPAGQLQVGKYSFSAGAFARVEAHIHQHFHDEELIIDEIGPLEIRGEGFSDLLRLILEQYGGKLLIVLRTEIVQEAIEAFQLDRFPLTRIEFKDL